MADDLMADDLMAGGVMAANRMDRKQLRHSIIQQIEGPIEEHVWTIDGLQTHLLTMGSGPPLLLLHGSMDCGALSWYPLLSELASRFRLFVPDCPGYGESEKPRGPYTIEFYMNWLDGFLNKAALQSVPVMGTSQGGALALNLALHSPESVSRMLLVNPAGLLKQYSSGVLRLVMRSLLRRLFPSPIFERWLEEYLVYDPSCMNELYASVKSYEEEIAALTEVQSLGSLTRSYYITRALATEQLQQITQPTLLLCGEYDFVFPPKGLRQIIPALPHAQLQVIPDSGHALHLEKPRTLANAVLSFLDATASTEQGASQHLSSPTQRHPTNAALNFA